MLTLKSLTLKNFLSIGNVTQAIHLNDHGLTLVLGNNTDANGGITKNGAGKSALLQAISFALYGEPLTRIKIDNLINNINLRGMLVTLDFEIDGKEYRIERGRKPNILKFFVNGEDIESIEDKSRGENRETQADISAIIGMSHTMFTHIVGLNTYTEPFLKLKAKEQRDVSEELLGVTQISTRAETLKKLMNETKTSLVQEEADIRAAQGVNARIALEIEEVQRKKDRWDIEHAQSVEELAKQIEDLSIIDFDHEKKQFDSLDAWNTHQRDLAGKLNLATTQLSGVQTEIKRIEADITRLTAIAEGGTHDNTRARREAELTRKMEHLSDLEGRIPALKAKIEAKQTEIDNPGEHTCVTCSQPLKGTEHLKTVMANLETQKAKLEAELTKLEANIAATKTEIAIISDEIKLAIKEAEEQVDASKAHLAERQNDLVAQQKKAEAINKDIIEAKDRLSLEDEKPQTFFETRDELYATQHLLDTCVLELDRERKKDNPHVSHLASLGATIQMVDFDEINRLQELLRHQEFLLKLLTNKDSFIRKKIIDQNLYYLNTRLNYYLDKLGLPHEVVFQNDLTVDITLLGRDFDFAQLSRGESNRVIMAVSWSFRDVWESLNQTINLMFCDEMIDSGLDSHGAEAALAVMKNFGRNNKNIFLVSHRDELIGRIDRVLLVSKDNGFTTVETQ